MTDTAVLEPDTLDGHVDWRQDKQGRQYIPRRDGRSGIVYRQGEETIDQAYDRDAKGPAKKPPKAKARKPPAPAAIDLKELEYALTEALQAPGMIAAMNGDEWGAQHFGHQAPRVARNLVVCSEHNPWLRTKLIAAMAGEGPLMNLMVFASLGASIFAYVVPPIIYYLNPPIPPGKPARAVEMVRERYRIPEEPDARPEAPAAAAAPLAS